MAKKQEISMVDMPSLAELRAFSDTELVDRYDTIRENNYVVGPEFYLDELSRREQHRQAEQMVDFTKQMRNMTIAIMILTLFNVIFVAVTVL